MSVNVADAHEQVNGAVVGTVCGVASVVDVDRGVLCSAAVYRGNER
mgnify:CR=1 FL=1